MRTRIKLFYRAEWETQYELQNEYGKWLDSYENSDVSYDFLMVAEQNVDNWKIVWFRSNNEKRT